MNAPIQAGYQKAIRFAAEKHHEQKFPGTELPYLLHLSCVTMEILAAVPFSPNMNVSFAVTTALLHDTMEDTDTSLEELETLFGSEVANAVAALTKNNSLAKEHKMQDSLDRIKLQSHDVWAVKLADRITNLQQPPEHWSQEKKMEYQKEAMIILEALKDGNAYLADRLNTAINDYSAFIAQD